MNRICQRPVNPLFRMGLIAVVLLLVLSNVGATEQPSEEADARRALEQARRELRKAEQASEQASEARGEARQALREAVEAYEDSAQRQDKILEQMQSLTEALKQYTRAVDELVREQRARLRPAPRREMENTAQAQADEHSDEGMGAEQTKEQTSSENAEAGGRNAMEAGENEGEEDEEQQAETDDETGAEVTETASADQGETEQAPTMPEELADGPVAPASQALSAVWQEDVTEELVAKKTLGPEGAQNSCAKCHTLETAAWKHTQHFEGFEERHRTDEARQILRDMDQRSMKFQNDLCRKCHYTSVSKNDRIRPLTGISCESCHGAGEDWVEIHNRAGGDPDGRVLTWGETEESGEERRERLEASRQQGMNHSGMLYALARRCVECHTVPNEDLVNQGQHTAGSDFGLVSWSQGEVRHNFLSSPGAPDDPSNPPASQERRRLFYVMGAVADLEYTLRNLVRLESEGSQFHEAMVARANRLRDKISEILEAESVPEIAFALKQVPEQYDMQTGTPAYLPDMLRRAGRQFEARYDGKALDGLDGLIPEETKGEAHQP